MASTLRPVCRGDLGYARKAPKEFAEAIGKRAPILARIAPALHDAIGDIPEPASLDKEEERFRLFDAVSQFLIAVSQKAPLVLILDDLHWSDRGVISMLSHVAHYVPEHSILLIGAYRDAEVDRKHPLSGALASLNRLRSFESLPLKGLEGKELADLLEMVADEDPPSDWSKRSSKPPKAIRCSSAKSCCICWRKARYSGTGRAGLPTSVLSNSAFLRACAKS